jgi:hypothetical protein
MNRAFTIPFFTAIMLAGSSVCFGQWTINNPGGDHAQTDHLACDGTCPVSGWADYFQFKWNEATQTHESYGACWGEDYVFCEIFEDAVGSGGTWWAVAYSSPTEGTYSVGSYRTRIGAPGGIFKTFGITSL